MSSFALASAGLGALAFALLAAIVAVAPKRTDVRRYLIAASTGTALWFALIAGYLASGPNRVELLSMVQLAELCRDVLWLAFVTRLLSGIGEVRYRRQLRATVAGVGLLTLALGTLLLAPRPLGMLLALDPWQVRKLYFVFALGVSLVGLVLVEQVFRNSARGARWAIKHLCFGIGLIFALDFYLYADAVLFNRLDAPVWAARGVVNALAVPMIALSVSRNRDWDLGIFVSRHVVFHGVTLTAAGLYLVLMAAAGYYIQLFGGEWGRALRIAFIGASLLVLLSLFFSVQLRSRLRMFLARHFYRNKYEYGEEWLKFTQALSGATLAPSSLNNTVLNAIADIVDSPGGLILQKLPSGEFAVAATLNLYETVAMEIPASSPFLAALEASGEVWRVDGGDEVDAERREQLPDELRVLPRAAYIVPILFRSELLAILVLAQTRSNQQLDVEDYDLLTTVARQAGSYLALLRATDALSEARQFETFNRLSAFLVHDLKNVVAQLSLITRNAERHGQNPEFVADAFQTVGDAVGKMNRMLSSLRQMHTDVAVDETFDLGEVARAAVAAKADVRPQPRLQVTDGVPVPIRGSRDRLLSVLEHLLQNAAEATPETGEITVGLARRGDRAYLTLTDTGCGMDREFINTRLFKPFDTTKGKAGMGIGAYESRHVVSSMKGELLVESAPGSGTCFTVVLPLANAPEETAGTVETGAKRA
ncbi:MAG: XrtA/PEP-CTERM system histidine kinase PrsK [Gammaproteobacteria bacterium]